MDRQQFENMFAGTPGQYLDTHEVEEALGLSEGMIKHGSVRIKCLSRI